MSRFIDKKNGEKRRKKAYNYLVNKGLQPHQAAGIIGNLMQESYAHLDSTIENSIGAVGIAQWLGPRKKSLIKFAKDQGTAHTNFDTQLDFLWNELTTTGDSWNRTADKDAFFNSKTAEEAAGIFVSKFERSGEKPGEKGYENRVKNAKSVYLQFNDKELYAKDDKGNIVNLNPETVTPEQLAISPKIKAEFYAKNYGIINEKAEATEAEPSAAAKEVEAALESKKKVKDEREAFIAELSNKDKVTQAEAAKVEEMQPEGATQDPYSMDISTPGNEFFNYFLPEGMQEGGRMTLNIPADTEEDNKIDPKDRESVVKESKDYVTDWFGSNVTKARMSENLGKNPFELIKPVNAGLEKIDKTTIDYKEKTGAEDAMYKDDKITFYGDPTESTSTHEFTHAMGVDNDLSKYMRDTFGNPAEAIQKKTGKAFDKAIAQEFNIDDSTSFGREKVLRTKEHSRYLTEQGELYPRIMEMRRVINVKPGDLIGDEQIQEIKSKSDNPLFKYYTDEQIKEMLNTLAVNEGKNPKDSRLV